MRTTRPRGIRASFAILAAAAISIAAAGLARADVPAVPPAPTRWLTDDAGLLDAGTAAALDARLEGYQQATGHQLLVWIDRTTNGVPVEDFSVHAFEKWKAGRKGVDDGLVLFLFTDDRVARIEVGYGLEGVVPDAVASRVIREVLTPELAAGRPAVGIEKALDALATAIGDGPLPGGAEGAASTRGPPRHRPIGWGQIIVYGIGAILFLILLITNPSLALYLLFSVLSGGRGGGGGGGGFSGGGGRSGGGGATGSW